MRGIPMDLLGSRIFFTILLIVALFYVWTKPVSIVAFLKQQLTNYFPTERTIVSAKANLKLSFEPQKMAQPELGKPWYGWIEVIEKGQHKNTITFLTAKNPPQTWGNEGLITEIWLDFDIAEDSPVIGKPMNYIEKIDGLQIALFFHHKLMEIKNGKLIITLNSSEGSERKEYEILPQKEQEGLFIFIDLRKN